MTPVTHGLATFQEYLLLKEPLPVLFENYVLPLDKNADQSSYISSKVNKNAIFLII